MSKQQQEDLSIKDIENLQEQIDKVKANFKSLNMRVVNVQGKIKELTEDVETVTETDTDTEQDTKREVQPLVTVTPRELFSMVVDLANGNYTRLMKETLPPLLQKYGLTIDSMGVRKVPIIHQKDVTIVPSERDDL